MGSEPAHHRTSYLREWILRATERGLHSGCVVCGKSFLEIREEITLGYLEGSHVSGETYDQRMARRAFQAGMRAGSFVLVPRGVSQAAACDGILYQIMPQNSQINHGPGVLPL